MLHPKAFTILALLLAALAAAPLGAPAAALAQETAPTAQQPDPNTIEETVE